MAVKNPLKEKTIKERIRSLSCLVERFLEEPLRENDLSAKPEMIGQLRNLLEKNLWQGHISREDPMWQFESDLYDPDNPELYTPDEVRAADIEFGVKSILFYHDLLKKGFWEAFKEKILSFGERRNEIENMPTNNSGSFLAEYADMADDNLYLGERNTICLKTELIEIPYSLEGGEIYFFKSGIDAILALQNLVSGLPVDIFKKCKNDRCGRVFILTSGHKREFCKNLCANRYIQRMKREQDPEAYRKYHKAYYRKKILGT
jgi:hypothetical protein